MGEPVNTEKPFALVPFLQLNPINKTKSKSGKEKENPGIRIAERKKTKEINNPKDQKQKKKKDLTD